MQLLHFLTPAVYLLLVTAVSVAVCKQIGLGSVLGLLIAGIVAGPFTPGPVATEDVGTLRNFTQLGVVLLLFMIGLEMDPRRLWRMRREVFGLGSLQVLITGGLLGLYLGMFQLSGWPIALAVGLTFALSSTALALQILEERGELASPHGRTAFAVLLFQDLAVVPLLALVPVLAAPLGSAGPVADLRALALVVGALILLVGAGRFLMPRLLEIVARQRSRDAFAVVALLAVLGAAWTTEQVGLPMELGAFLMGMLLSQSTYQYQLLAQIQPFKGMLMGLFFITVGMSIDVGLLFADLRTVAAALVVIMAIKALVLFVLCLAFGRPLAEAIRVSLLMPQCGEFGFVLLALARQVGLLDDGTFLTGIVVIAVSMLATPFSVKVGDMLAGRATRLAGGRRHVPAKAPEVDPVLSNHVVVAGYGRIGQTLCALLQASQIPYLAFDNEHSRVAVAGRVGHRVYFGELEDPDFLGSVGLGRAALAVIATDNRLATRRGVTLIRQLFPHVPLLARVRDLREAAEIEAMGATMALPEVVESGLNFGREVLTRAGLPGDEAESLVDSVRRNDYEFIRALADGNGEGLAKLRLKRKPTKEDT